MFPNIKFGHSLFGASLFELSLICLSANLANNPRYELNLLHCLTRNIQIFDLLFSFMGLNNYNLTINVFTNFNKFHISKKLINNIYKAKYY